MTQIKTLEISNFRNLPSVTIHPAKHFNVFYGQNGAGKTSLLEAIYYFGFGRSFRTSVATNLIQKGFNQFTLFSQLESRDNFISVGVERNLSGQKRIRCNGENIRSTSTIAEYMPIQLISTDSYRYFHDGPNTRRQFINWGLFHVEPSFFSLWQRLLQLLKQRNAALKAKLPNSELSVWDAELTGLSNKIDALRIRYVQQLQPILTTLLSKILIDLPLSLQYSRGWEGESFKEALKASAFRDKALGYTSAGPHRADLKLLIDDTPAGDILSQGQQKLASYALYLAQGQLLQDISNKHPIYLIDDLPSELDPERRTAITSVLSSLDAQVFITGITKDELRDAISLKESRLFHVEHNVIQEAEAGANYLTEEACC